MGAGPSFRDYPWKEGYETGVDHLVNDFYVPALSRAVRYDRKAGFFTSGALCVAAKGLAHFIKNGGKMRLLVSCRLHREDVEAIEKGVALKDQVERRLLADWSDPKDALARDRLGFLAELVAQDRLEVRVVYLVGPDGKPVAASEDHAIFHEKVGVLTDAAGDRIAFIGSINETVQAWLYNYESFDVYRSWVEPSRVERHAVAFEKLWNGERPGTQVMDLPAAARQKLLDYRPVEPLPYDPEEIEVQPAGQREALAVSADAADVLRLQFIQDAPFLHGGGYLGAATARVDPLPHQHQVLRRVYEQFPARFLLCDEVGLGKTIEAGLILRELVIHGLVRRALILAPHNTLHQWQETLAERFGLHFTRYTGRVYLEPDGTELPVAGNPWDGRNFILASSHLVRLEERQGPLLEAEPFDLIILDEAHHARRRSPTGDEYRPNNLLRLMQRLQERTEGLLLCTATPMQIDPVEVWDLLMLVGLSGLWASDARRFREFFRQIRLFPEGNADFVLAMTADALENGVELDPQFEAEARRCLGNLRWRRAYRAIRETLERRSVLADPQAAEMLRNFALHHTPLRRFMCRNTRRLLKEYYERGLIPHRPADRQCEDKFVSLTPEEQALYLRVEEFLRKYFVSSVSGSRKGLGFVVNTYRRRLTSSSRAIIETLRRKLEAMEGKTGAADETIAGLPLEYLAEDDTLEELDDDEVRLLAESSASPEAIQELRDLIADLERLPEDTKLLMLLSDLQELMKRHQKALIFTQYRDTMYYLRDHLFLRRGARVACYHGGQGEVWENGEWRPISKEELQRRFMETDDYDILVCTDSASEGLNLQAASLLINYDMPWNPMRVEQRIGRIDRLGQVSKTVTIINYYYKDTVEDVVYSRLRKRINLFVDVVGALQPILSRVPRLFERFYEEGGQITAIEADLEELIQEAEEIKSDPFNLDELTRPDWKPLPLGAPPVTPEEIETVFAASPRIRAVCKLRPVGNGRFRLTWVGREYTVAFRPEAVATGIRYLTYGDPLFEAILRAALFGGQTGSVPWLSRQVRKAGKAQAVAYQVHTGSGWKPIHRLSELEDALRTGGVEPVAPAPDLVSNRLEAIRQRQEKARKATYQGQLATLRAQARQLLIELAAALCVAKQVAPPAVGETYDGTGLVRNYSYRPGDDTWKYLRERVAEWTSAEGLPVPRDLIEEMREQTRREHINSVLARLRTRAGELVERMRILHERVQHAVE